MSKIRLISPFFDLCFSEPALVLCIRYKHQTSSSYKIFVKYTFIVFYELKRRKQKITI